jgi:hypothetical protein
MEDSNFNIDEHFSEKKYRKDEIEPKNNIELTFEDQAWIFIGSLFSMGILGVIMFFKYLSEGYKKKANQVCVLAIVGVVIMFFISIIVQLGK